MTETPRPTDDTAALRAAVESFAARLDRIEAQAAQPSALGSAQDRLTGAWEALRGSAKGPEDGQPGPDRKGLLWLALMICASLLALILAVELAEEIVEGLWHFGHWID